MNVSPKPALNRVAAFTIAELIVASAAMSLLLGAVVSALVLVAHAVPTDESETANAVRGSDVLETLSADLLTATAFTERSERAFTILVPDRNNDGSPEVIRYAWSGSTGAPLTRAYNGDAAVAILENLADFGLIYAIRTEEVETTTPGTISSETLLFSHVAAADLGDATTTSLNWIGQYFVPTLPSEANGWSVSRVRLVARQRSTADGVSSVQIRASGAGKAPSNTILEQVPMLESALSTNYAWVEFPFWSVRKRTPGEGLCLVIQWSSGADAGTVQYRTKGVTGVNGALLETTLGGLLWGASENQAMNIEVYGAYTLPASSSSSTHSYVTGATIRIRFGDSRAVRVQTSVSLLNMPEIAP